MAIPELTIANSMKAIFNFEKDLQYKNCYLYCSGFTLNYSSMKVFSNTIASLGKLSIVITSLFLLNNCTYISYINEADIPNIKPGGLVTIQGVTEDGKKYKFTTECELLGIREYPNENYDYTPKDRLFAATFQTINKPENLILEFDFQTSPFTPNPANSPFAVTKLGGSFLLDNKKYTIGREFLNNIGYSASVTNIDKPGQLTIVDMNSTKSFRPPSDTFRIVVETFLLPKR